MGKSVSQGKSFDISKWEVWEAYRRVKANKGAPGVDGQTIEAFESDLKNNLYRVWNRMASGYYFPPAVRAVPIPKADGGIRVLGVATVTSYCPPGQPCVGMFPYFVNFLLVRTPFGVCLRVCPRAPTASVSFSGFGLVQRCRRGLPRWGAG